MKKALVLLILLSASGFSYSQLISGTLMDSQRKLLTPYDFKIKGRYKGVKYFELAVNAEGKVTGVKEEVKSDSFVSTPAKLMAQGRLLDLGFEGATHFPKFQHVLVKIEFVKE